MLDRIDHVGIARHDLAPGTPVGRFLARRGEGVHHIGHGVADITAALAAIGGRGVRLLDQRPGHGSMGAVIAFCTRPMWAGC